MPEPQVAASRRRFGLRTGSGLFAVALSCAALWSCGGDDGADAGAVASSGGAGSGNGGIGGSDGGAGGGGGEQSLPLAGEPCVGYTLLGSPENDGGSDFKAMLIDMDGNLVHRFSITGFPPKMLPGGSLIGCAGVFPTSYDCVEMQEVDWNGELEWSFSDFADAGNGTTAARHHHDLQREGNPVGYYAPGQDFVQGGKTLVLAHARRIVPEIRDGAIDDDVLYEVDSAGARTDFVWYAGDHVEELGFDAAERNDIRTRDPSLSYIEWLHGNSASLLGSNHWFDEGRAEFHPDNIIYSSRAANFVVIISRETGEVVWRVGPDFAGRPEASLGQFAGQHNPHMIPRGLPGAGNILVFDNGATSGYGGTSTTGNPNRYGRDYSRVLEFDPVTKEVVWEYGTASGDERFFSFLLSNAQRLPNGNTLITIGMAGRLIEVTPDHRVVWEYQYEPNSSGTRPEWIYRSYRIAPEWLPEGENAAHGDYATWASLFEAP
jgi:hypothetical protein